MACLNRPFVASHILARRCHPATTIHLLSWLHAPAPAGWSLLPTSTDSCFPRSVKYLPSFLMEHTAITRPTGLVPTYIRSPSGLHRSDRTHPPRVFSE